MTGWGWLKRGWKDSGLRSLARGLLTSRGMRPWYQAWLRRSVLLSFSSSSSSLCSFSGEESRMYFSLENCVGIVKLASDSAARLFVSPNSSSCPRSSSIKACPADGPHLWVPNPARVNSRCIPPECTSTRGGCNEAKSQVLSSRTPTGYEIAKGAGQASCHQHHGTGQRQRAPALSHPRKPVRSKGLETSWRILQYKNALETAGPS